VRAKTWGGVLATAGGVIFYGQPNGGFAAVNQRNGSALAIPYQRSHESFSNDVYGARQQYVAIAAGPNILCFGPTAHRRALTMEARLQPCRSDAGTVDK
jgi:alcohol dehydrogenase (cytochrome c)